MNQMVRQTLKELMARHGLSLSEDARRCEAWLLDLCPLDRREVNGLVIAMKGGVVNDLRVSSTSIPTQVLARLSRQLTEWGMADDLAQGAVAAWEEAISPLREMRRFLGHEAPISGLSFSPNGRLFMSTDQQDEVRLWDVATGKVLRRMRDIGEVLGLAFSRSHCALLLWDEENTDLLAITDHNPRLLLKRPDEERKETLRIWDVGTGSQWKYLGNDDLPYAGIAFSADGRYVATIYDSHSPPPATKPSAKGGRSTICLLDCESEVETAVASALELPGSAAQPVLSFSTSGEFIVSVGWEGTELYRLSSLSGYLRWKYSVEKARCKDVSPDGNRAVAAVGEWGGETLKIIETTLGRGDQLGYLRGHKGLVWSAIFSPNGKFALSGGQDKTVRLWDVEKHFVIPFERRRPNEEWGQVTAPNLCCFEGHKEAVTCLAFSPDGRFALSGGKDKAICLWQLPTGREPASRTRNENLERA